MDSKNTTNRGCPILRAVVFRAKGGRPQIYTPPIFILSDARGTMWSDRAGRAIFRAGTAFRPYVNGLEISGLWALRDALFILSSQLTFFFTACPAGAPASRALGIARNTGSFAPKMQALRYHRPLRSYCGVKPGHGFARCGLSGSKCSGVNAVLRWMPRCYAVAHPHTEGEPAFCRAPNSKVLRHTSK